jgi:hypothetical protein
MIIDGGESDETDVHPQICARKNNPRISGLHAATFFRKLPSSENIWNLVSIASEHTTGTVQSVRE